MPESLELFDTHCHLNDTEAFPSPDEAIQEARDAGVTRLTVIGVDADSSARAIQLAERHAGVVATVGWHPNYTATYDRGQLPLLEELLRHPKVVAVGEMGLDRHWDYATPEQQEIALIDQMELALRVGKPMVIHCRKAYGELLDRFEAQPKLTPFVMHCFSGDENDARRAMALGAYFGVDGPLTYPKSEELRSLVATLPHDRVLIETDSPYMSPHPHRGKPNRPAWVVLVNQRLAEIWGCDALEAARITTSNAMRFYGITD